MIPPKANRKDNRDYDNALYKARNLFEKFFAKLKQFRGIATATKSGRSISSAESTSPQP